MNQTILFIDGENFLNKIEEILRKGSADKSRIDISTIDFNELFKLPLSEFTMTRKIFYAAKLHIHADTQKKSLELIRAQRKLRNTLVNQGFEFKIGGNVRAQLVEIDGKKKVVFKEKGVDVKIAVDLVSLSADKVLKTAILCSSDSDLQPAIKELHQRGTEVVYLGFESKPNKGLTYTTDRTILFRNAEVLNLCQAK